MKNSTRKTVFLLAVASGVIAFVPQAAYAILGIGDIVFDPTNYAVIGEIWNQDISNGMKLAQTYNKTVSIYKNAVDHYHLAQAMAKRIDTKSTWQTSMFGLGNEYAKAHYGESINFSAVMNGDVTNAGTAWGQATLGIPSTAHLTGTTAPNNHRMSEYATIQLLDQTSTRCAQILAQYRQMQTANQAAEEQLRADTVDQSDAKNSTVGVLNVISGGQMHANTTARAQANLQACYAEQATLQAKIQRDRMAEEQNWYATVANARATSPATLDPTATAAALGGYLLP